MTMTTTVTGGEIPVPLLPPPSSLSPIFLLPPPPSYSDNDLAHHSSVFGRSSAELSRVRSGLWLFVRPLAHSSAATPIYHRRDVKSDRCKFPSPPLPCPISSPLLSSLHYVGELGVWRLFGGISPISCCTRSGHL